MRRTLSILVLLLQIEGAVTATDRPPAPTPLAVRQPVKVCIFSSVVTDLVNNIGGDLIESHLIGPDMAVDPHAYLPTTGELQAVADKDIVFLSGLGMESYEDTLRKLHGRAAIIQVGDLAVQGVRPEEAGGSNKHRTDPHWWQSVDCAKQACVVIRDALIHADPLQAPSYEEHTRTYLNQLDELDSWIKRQVDALPRFHRKIISSHDAFGYFARQYGFTLCAVKGADSRDQVSPSRVAEIIDTLRNEKVKTVFYEAIDDPKWIEEIGAKAGVQPSGPLYADGLGQPDGGTYIAMMRHNVTTLVAGLRR